MRVLQLHTRYRQRGGEDAVVDAERALLEAAGHTVELLEAQNPDAPGPSAAALVRAPWNSAARRRAAERIRASRPDVIHVHNTWFAMSPAVLEAAAEAAPVVMTLHNYRITCSNALLYRDGAVCEECVGSHPWHGVAHACYRGSRPQSVFAAATIAVNRRRGTWTDLVDVYLALTPFAKDKLEVAGLPGARIRVKPHFTPPCDSRPRPPSASRDLVFVGRLSPEKGVDVLLEAMTAVAPSDLRLVIVGDGPDRDRLERMAPPNVSFTGTLGPSDVTGRLLGARALLFPSVWYETFGLTMIEAMAAGLPVVASALGGSPDVVGEVAGLHVAPGDATAWATALRRLCSDAEVDAMGAAALQRWHERYRPEQALQALEDAYAAARSHRAAR